MLQSQQVKSSLIISIFFLIFVFVLTGSPWTLMFFYDSKYVEPLH